EVLAEQAGQLARRDVSRWQGEDRMRPTGGFGGLGSVLLGGVLLESIFGGGRGTFGGRGGRRHGGGFGGRRPGSFGGRSTGGRRGGGGRF
ncbi:MAG TPA: hypothetical protein VF183_07720, partial [Acidimicrobiales bacterium]